MARKPLHNFEFSVPAPADAELRYESNHPKASEFGGQCWRTRLLLFVIPPATRAQHSLSEGLYVLFLRFAKGDTALPALISAQRFFAAATIRARPAALI